MTQLTRVVVVVVVGLALGSLAIAGVPRPELHARVADSALVERLDGAADGERLPVILQTRDVLRHDALTKQLRSLGIDPGHAFRNLPAFALRLTAAEIERVLDLGEVAGTSLDDDVRASLTTASGAVGAVAARAAGFTGAGITVAVIDSGVAPFEELAGSGVDVSLRMDFVGGLVAPGAARDELGHGTHIAGIIAADGLTLADAPGIVGVAAGAGIVSLRVLDAEGRGSISDVMRALDWALDNRAAHNIRIVNLSLGRPVSESWRTDPLCQSIAVAWRAGMFVVASAGNFGREGTGYGRISSPGNCPYPLTVGAMNARATVTTDDDVLATYSSRGPSAIDLVAKPDLVAPGNRVVSLRSVGSTYDELLPKNRLPLRTTAGTVAVPEAFFALSGTSMAAPVAAAAAALLLERDPSLSPDDLKVTLMAAARPHATYGLLDIGAGYLDVTAALANLRHLSAPALSPSLVVAADGTWSLIPTVEVGASQPPVAWWRDGLSGEVFLWGDGLLTGDIFLWGDGVLEGDVFLWGDIFLWGDAVIHSYASTGDPLTGGVSRPRSRIDHRQRTDPTGQRWSR